MIYYIESNFSLKFNNHCKLKSLNKYSKMYGTQIYPNPNMRMAGINTTAIPMLGVAGSGGVFNNIFIYHGTSIGLQSKVD